MYHGKIKQTTINNELQLKKPQKLNSNFVHQKELVLYSKLSDNKRPFSRQNSISEVQRDKGSRLYGGRF